MKKLLFFPAIILMMSCTPTDLSQEQIEKWVRTNTVEQGTSYTTNFKNNYGANHSASMDGITITNMGQLEIDDENTRSIFVDFKYLEVYFNGSYTDKDNEKRSCRFVFKKSTDGKWYLSNIRGDSNRPFGSWIGQIKKRNEKEPIQ